MKVKTGLRHASQVEITEGLQAGDVVVTAGQLRLREGVAVQVGAGAPTAGVPGKAPDDGKAAKQGS